MPKLISLDKFRTEGKLAEGTDGIRVPFMAEVKVEDDTKRQLLFTISTNSIDRSGDKINQSGWDLESYRKNPVVLIFHDYGNFPVAKSNHIWTENDKLKSITEFVPAGNPAIGRTAEGAYQLYKQGFMSASSVGFLPKKYNYAEDKDRKFGIDFEEQELLEYSLVPVPANPEALIEARGMGIDDSAIMEMALSYIFPKGINRRKFESFLSDSGFSRKEALTLAALTPKELVQSDSEAEIRDCIANLQRFRDSLK